MFALGIRYLMGRALATACTNREQAEWPLHPDRVFMALVAAFGETGGENTEALSLDWLAGLPPPALFVQESYSRRSVCSSFVPVNDDPYPCEENKSTGKITPHQIMGSLPIGRRRVERQFPAVAMADPNIFLIWPQHTISDFHRQTLEHLCEQVTYLGHSASPVQMWIEEQPPAPNLVPVDGTAQVRLRVFGPGRLDNLKARYAAGMRPLPSLWQGYAAPRTEVQRLEPHTVFDEQLLVLRQVAGRRFSLESTLRLTQTLRKTLMKRAGEDAVPAWLSGHAPNGTPNHGEHLAIFPLGFVGREHADGHILGLGLALPRSLPDEHAAQLITWLELKNEPGLFQAKLNFGSDGICLLEGEPQTVSDRTTLRASTYLGPACRWATVTPIVLDHFPRRQLTKEEIVAAACERIGLPRPAAVQVGYAPSLSGVPHSRSFPALPQRPSRAPRPLTHAVIHFDQPVRGPVLLGAGRYLGYGLCRPHDCDFDARQQACRLPEREDRP
jgi:CRISPR-associated protein Csb2